MRRAKINPAKTRKYQRIDALIIREKKVRAYVLITHSSYSFATMAAGCLRHDACEVLNGNKTS
ncbi:hypothetical protein WN51_05670 [Melipona quadrifasciata]|uniref:Uncharacterized protein n=1 Tax=Melipona quadrifasciata TaxID=166423 RepID=A0A0M8ZV99_9HYME|nr:hypothetical protein WN51_05670 [Melipona quadrifasciata]